MPDPWYPVAALVLPTGEVVLADRNRNRLFRMDAPDRPPMRLPLPGTPPVEWTALSGAPGLSFYALDGPGRAVHQYDYQGNYLGVALDLEVAAAELELGSMEPAGLAVDRAGHALITDRLGDRILVFGPGWGFLGVWGQSGSDLGSWRRPGAVAVGEGGSYIVADEGNRRVVLIDSFGNVLGVRDLDDVPLGVTVLDRGRYAVSCANWIEILGQGLTVEQSLAIPPGPGCSGTPHATSAVAGDRGLLLVGEGCSGRLLQLTRQGA